MRTANKCACRSIGFRSHAARIHHHHVGHGRPAFGKSSVAQTIANGLTIGAGRPAAEVLDVE
jgi:hypothetical protein